jgi:precorrin-2 methylase
MPRIVRLLNELDLLERSVLVERTAQEQERVIHDLTEVKADELHYFSTIIVRCR